MVYSLKCGSCLQDNNVSATDEPIVWTCDTCKSDNTSSLPRQADKSLVTDYTKAKSILDPVSAGKATKVVTASKLDVSASKDVAVDVAVADAEVIK